MSQFNKQSQENEQVSSLIESADVAEMIWFLLKCVVTKKICTHTNTINVAQYSNLTAHLVIFSYLLTHDMV